MTRAWRFGTSRHKSTHVTVRRSQRRAARANSPESRTPIGQRPSGHSQRPVGVTPARPHAGRVSATVARRPDISEALRVAGCSKHRAEGLASRTLAPPAVHFAAALHARPSKARMQATIACGFEYTYGTRLRQLVYLLADETT